MKKILTLVLVLALSTALLAGCVAPTQVAEVHPASAQGESIAIQPELAALSLAEATAAGGILCLKINPEIALHYDENGKVTKLEGRNPDGVQILENFTDYVGKDTSEVLAELVELIGKAGYFVEEVDGTARRIVLELDPGSLVPHDQFLQDMAEHVKLCVESQSWVGEKEYDYPDPTIPAASEPSVTQQAPAAATSSKTGSTSTSVPAGLCPVCADDDCDDGKYCDDAHEKAENLKEYERLISGEVCPTCADPDCDDGKYCDDADEKKENQAENAAKKASAGKTSSTSSGKSTSSGSKTSTSGKSGSSDKSSTSTSVPAGLCPVCADDDCDDGKYCDDADEKKENLREHEKKKSGKVCSVCGDDDCDDGKYCDGDD